MSNTNKKLAFVLFWLIVLACAVYLGFFIFKTSSVIEGQRYFALFDDSMISMQYARNFAEGNGLVFSAGDERVEGFSNPLWVLFMAFFHLFKLPSHLVSLPIQIAGALFIIANLFVVRKIAQRLAGDNWLIPLLAVFLTAFYFPLNTWSVQGTEVSVLTLMLSIAVLGAIDTLQDDRFRKAPYILLAISTWVRFDMAVPMIALTVIMAWRDEHQRRQHLQWGLGLLTGALLLQTVIRYAYYGELLPNTYYLKVIGVSLFDRIYRGLAVFGQFLWVPGWVFFLLPFLLLALWPSHANWLLLALIAGQAAYSIYVGGDAWEHKGGANRFIAIAMPLFFTLFVVTLNQLREALVKLGQQKWLPKLSQAILALFVVVSLFNFNTLRENFSLEKWTLQFDPPIFVAGTQRYTELGLTLKSITEEPATIAVATAGNIVYFAERSAIDLLGKADKVIARSQPHANNGVLNNVEDIFRPGHNKWDYEYSIGQLAPDIIAQVWGNSGELEPYLQAGNYGYYEVDGFPLYIKNDSPYVLWDQIPEIE